jgi:hypothetical protein
MDNALLFSVQQNKRDMRMGSGLCRPRRGRQQVKRDMRIGNKWEEQYAKFEDYDGMPVDGSTLSNWKKSQLARFEARIKTEIAGNDGSTAWRDGRTKLLVCIAKKENNKWEEQYAAFEDYDGMTK